MDVAVIAASMTDFGRREAWIGELLASAASKCLDSAGVDPDEVDFLTASNMASGEFEGQTGVMNALAADVGLVPAYAQRVDQTSASGAGGLYAAWQSVASGASDLSLLVGGEKMTNRSTGEASDVISSLTHPEEYKHGVTLPSFGALAARAYLDRYDVPRESLARVSVKNHANGARNPHAQFQSAIDVEDVLDSPLVADPLRLYDYCPVTDGSAALLLCPADRADSYADEWLRIAGIAGATDTQVVHQRADPLAMDAVAESGRAAHDMAGTDPSAVDVAELHDMVSVLELLEMEALGFSPEGEAWRDVDAGRTDPDGELPINTSGGLKSRGHPLGATGVAQVVELFEQFTGRAGDRQLDPSGGLETGLACNVGGFGNGVVTTIVEAGS